MTAGLKPYPRVKDTGIPTLGEIPEHWNVQKLRSLLHPVAERNRPDLPLLSVVRDQGVILRDLSSKDKNHNYVPDDLTNYKVVLKGQFAMNKMKAWQGSYGVSNYNGIVSPAYFVFRLGSIDGGYFHTAIRSRAYVPSFTQASDGVRIGQWDLSQPRMREIALAVPTGPEQNAIARFLQYKNCRIQKHIRAKEKLIALLDEYKQGLIHQAVTGQIDVRTGEPYPEYKESGVEWIGTMPSHWQRTRLKALIQPIDVRSAEGKETLLSLRRDHGIVVYAEHFSRPPQGASLVGYKLIKLGHLVVNRLQANNGLIFCSALSGVVSPDYSVFEKKSEVRVRFLGEVLRTRLFRTHFRRQATGLGTGTAGFLRLYDDDFLATPFCLPPFSEQTRILAYIDSVVRQTESAAERTSQSIAFLREYRTRLIADAVTGKLDVREVAATLPEIDLLASDDQTDKSPDTDNTPARDQENQPPEVAA